MISLLSTTVAMHYSPHASATILRAYLAREHPAHHTLQEEGHLSDEQVHATVVAQ